MKNKNHLLTSFLSISFLLAACGGGTNPPADEGSWEEMTYAQFKEKFDAKDDCLYNHVQITYKNDLHISEDGSLNVYNILEDLIDGKWIIDTAVSTSLEEIASQMILSTAQVETYGNLSEGYTSKFYKGEDSKYKVVFSKTNSEVAETSTLICNEYFYCLDSIFTKGEAIATESHATWSTNSEVPVMNVSQKRFVYKSVTGVPENPNYLSRNCIENMKVTFYKGGDISIRYTATPDMPNTDTVFFGNYTQEGDSISYKLDYEIESYGTVSWSEAQTNAYKNLTGSVIGNEVKIVFPSVRGSAGSIEYKAYIMFTLLEYVNE